MTILNWQTSVVYHYFQINVSGTYRYVEQTYFRRYLMYNTLFHTHFMQRKQVQDFNFKLYIVIYNLRDK